MLNRNIGLEPDKKTRGGNPRMRRVAELTANEFDGTEISRDCMQIPQGYAINLSHRIGSSVSLSGSDLTS